MGRRPVGEPAHYHRLLSKDVDTVEVWTTCYLQVLEGPDPVLEWVKGTALRPVLDELTGEELETFLERYRRELRSAYRQGPDGTTLFPFPRVFIVAHKLGETSHQRSDGTGLGSGRPLPNPEIVR